LRKPETLVENFPLDGAVEVETLANGAGRQEKFVGAEVEDHRRLLSFVAIPETWLNKS
jgi:hypothetical protein